MDFYSFSTSEIELKFINNHWNDTYCVNATSDADWQPSSTSKIMVSTFAGLFFLLTVFGIFISVKYLIIKSKVKRVTLICFYFCAILQLIGRMSILIMLNWNVYFATYPLILSTISLMFGLLTGTCHIQILCQLTVDLKTLQCKSKEDFEQCMKLKKIYCACLIAWFVLLTGASAYFFITVYFPFVMGGFAILFSIQAVYLLIVNGVLNATLTKIFDVEQFTVERRFLKTTLCAFSLSYLVVMVRAIFIETLVFRYNSRTWICNNNDTANLINVIMWSLIDLFPFGTIFFLHWRNFRHEFQKQEILRSHESSPTGNEQVLLNSAEQYSITNNYHESVPQNDFTSIMLTRVDQAQN